jgi:AcrR family transcriptional regulator
MGIQRVSDEDIVRAARAALLEGGARVTSRDIARRAGIGKSTLNDRFGTKEALLLEAITIDRPPWALDLARVVGVGEIRANVHGLFVAMVRYAATVAPIVAAARALPALAVELDIATIRGEEWLADYVDAEVHLGRLRACWSCQTARVLASIAWDAADARAQDDVGQLIAGIWHGLAVRSAEAPPSSEDAVVGTWPPPPPDDPAAHAKAIAWALPLRHDRGSRLEEDLRNLAPRREPSWDELLTPSAPETVRCATLEAARAPSKALLPSRELLRRIAWRRRVRRRARRVWAKRPRRDDKMRQAAGAASSASSSRRGFCGVPS